MTSLGIQRGEIPTTMIKSPTKSRMFFASEDVEAWKVREETRQTMIACHRVISRLRGRYDSPRAFLDAALHDLADLYPSADGS